MQGVERLWIVSHEPIGTIGALSRFIREAPR